MNKVLMSGRLTRDPEMRTTATGKDVASFSIAVDRKYKRDGEPTADFFNCTVWEQSARYISDYGQKGMRISVVGRLANRKYTANDGTERTVTEIQAEEVSILEKREDGGQSSPTSNGGGSRATQGGGGSSAGRATSTVDEYDPFADE